MTLQGAAQLQAKLGRLIRSLPGIAEDVARQSVSDVADAVKADIGDQSMSGWSRGKPIQMRGVVAKGHAAAIVPAGRAAGPLRVMESGRNASGGVGGFQGPGINRRTGATSARTRATGRGGSRGGRRYNGRTPARGTWSDAESRAGAQLGRRSASSLLRVMSGIFTKG